MEAHTCPEAHSRVKLRFCRAQVKVKDAVASATNYALWTQTVSLAVREGALPTTTAVEQQGAATRAEHEEARAHADTI